MAFEFRKLSVGALLKLGFLSNLGFWTATGLILGILSLIGVVPVTINGEVKYGLAGLIGALFVAMIFSLIGSIVFMLGGLVARVVPLLGKQSIDAGNIA